MFKELKVKTTPCDSKVGKTRKAQDETVRNSRGRLSKPDRAIELGTISEHNGKEDLLFLLKILSFLLHRE